MEKPRTYIKYLRENEIPPEKRELADKVLKFAKLYFNFDGEIKIQWFERATPQFFEVDQVLGRLEEVVLGENRAKTDWFVSEGFWGGWPFLKDKNCILISANLDQEGIIFVTLHEATHDILGLLNEEETNRIVKNLFESCKKYVLAK